MDRFNLMLLCVSKSTLSRLSYLTTTSVVQMFYPLKYNYIFRVPITNKRTTNKKEGHCPLRLQIILSKGTWASLKTNTFSIGENYLIAFETIWTTKRGLSILS